MAAAATSSASGMGRHRAEGHSYGPVLLASVLPVIAGCFNLIYGIAVTASAQHRLPPPWLPGALAAYPGRPPDMRAGPDRYVHRGDRPTGR